ncbi:Platelet-activating factor acetylhydrolase [Nesidiocoris tenuis]|uniref:Platelet-activating factor acetylhydrolase n=1 Tax=Nesidiocoris tenuis TaxID=355587 RepID=A0ABN7ADX8_9HEMI|nr:Platelet-activating factor acetylhydrolase [Nesidiocoris tenuis]
MNPCAIPEMRSDEKDGRWLSQHNHHISETKEREPEVVLIGDSIIHHLQLRPIWSELYEPLHCLNFGISGDKTQHVLWRIQNGELDNIRPKVVVIHVGTNNVDDTAEHVADAIVAIVNETRARLPEAYILVVELLPRGQNPNPLRDKNSEVNRIINVKLNGLLKVATVCGDLGLVQPDGTISHHDMPDFLHLSDAGYRKAFENVSEVLHQLVFAVEEDVALSE